MTQRKLAIIHTTPVTVDALKALAKELMPETAVINFVDDSILPELAANGGDLSAVEKRWVAYAAFAEEQGADAVLSACSSVGELAAVAQRTAKVPVLRIDEAMAEEAVRRGTRIGVAATLPTTLEPTTRLLAEKAQELGRPIELMPMLAAEAYRLLMSGDQAGHDRVLGEELIRLGAQADVIVLAQASMARVVATLPQELRDRCLSSPRLGMERVKRVLEGAQG